MRLFMSILVLIVSVRAHAFCAAITNVPSSIKNKTPVLEVHLPNRPEKMPSLIEHQKIADPDGMLTLYVFWNLLNSGNLPMENDTSNINTTINYLGRLYYYYTTEKRRSGFLQTEAAAMSWSSKAKAVSELSDLIPQLQEARDNGESFEPFMEPIGDFIRKYSNLHTYKVRMKYMFDQWERETRRTPEKIFNSIFIRGSHKSLSDPACIEFENQDLQYAFLGDEVPQGNTRFAENEVDSDVEVAEMGEIEDSTPSDPREGRYARDDFGPDLPIENVELTSSEPANY